MADLHELPIYMDTAIWISHLCLQASGDAIEHRQKSKTDIKAKDVDSKIRKYLKPEKPRMLNLGICDGSETASYADLNYLVTGVGMGRASLEFAQKTWTNPNIENWLLSDMHYLTCPAESFDCIVMVHTFEHSIAPMLLMIQLWKVLKIGGIVYIEIPLKNETDNPNSTLQHVIVHTSRQMIHLATKCGFDVLEHNEIGSGNEFILRKRELQLTDDNLIDRMFNFIINELKKNNKW